MLSSKEHRKTILTIAIGFLLLSFAMKYLWLCIFAILLGVLGFLSKHVAAIIHFYWMGFAKIMGKITQPIILGVVYFAILFPLSLISKISRKDPLMLKNRASSTFRESNKSFSKETFEKTW